MRIGLFGGSFDPVHTEHVAAAIAAKESLRLDRLYVIPSYLAPHKRGGASAEGADRAEMCRLAFRGVAEVSDCELRSGGTSYTYLTCRRFRAMFPSDELYFLVGADMLLDFFHWKKPEEILSCVTLCALGRGGALPEMHAAFRERFHADYLEIGFVGADISSTKIRVDLAFGKKTDVCGEVQTYISERGLYTCPAIGEALALETEERREHSYRVAMLAAMRSRSAGISERDALLAAAIHDCGKYVPLTSPLLEGFRLPPAVPPPVVHQFTGAFLAEKFGVKEEEILDAIRYHASGREDMTPLGTLIYTADLLEPSRDFDGVEELRKLFWIDLDRCMEAALEHQIAYLKAGKKEIYPLTLRAYTFLKSKNRHFE